MNTTLNKIYAHNPCADGWKKLLSSLGKTTADDEPVSIEYIIDSNGLSDALWALRAVDGIERESRLLACDYAERVLPIWYDKYPADHRPAEAIRVARLYANNNATEDDLLAAGAAAQDAAQAAAGDAAQAAAGAVAGAAAGAAAGVAAGVFAGAAAGAAARAAARAAAWAAAWADRAAWAAAWAAECEWQDIKLRQMLRGKIYRVTETEGS